MFKEWGNHKYIQHLSLTARKILFSNDRHAMPWINKIVACQRTIGERIGHVATSINEMRRKLEKTPDLNEAETHSLRSDVSNMEKIKARFSMFKVLFHFLKLRVEVEDTSQRIRNGPPHQRLGLCDSLEMKLDPIRACRNDFAEFAKTVHEYDEDALLKEVIENCRDMIDEIRSHVKKIRQ